MNWCHRWRPAHLAAIVLIALAGASALLPWATASAGTAHVTTTGLEGDGVITLAAALGLLAAVLGSVYGPINGLAMAAIAIVLGALIAAVGIYDWADAFWSVQAEPGVSLSAGSGVVLTAIAGLAIVLDGVFGDWGSTGAPAAIKGLG